MCPALTPVRWQPVVGQADLLGVGVSPKWVLKRLRIHQAVEQLSAQPPSDWTDLALELGNYDHAHFIRDFQLVVGRSPARYAAEAAAAR